MKKTFCNSKCALGRNGRWLKGEIVLHNDVHVCCGICSKHTEHLRRFRKFSEASVTGICGSAIEREALTKHMGSAAHIHAEALENGPLSCTLHQWVVHPFSLTNWLVNKYI